MSTFCRSYVWYHVRITYDLSTDLKDSPAKTLNVSSHEHLPCSKLSSWKFRVRSLYLVYTASSLKSSAKHAFVKIVWWTTLHQTPAWVSICKSRFLLRNLIAVCPSSVFTFEVECNSGVFCWMHQFERLGCQNGQSVVFFWCYFNKIEKRRLRQTRYIFYDDYIITSFGAYRLPSDVNS